MRCVRPLFVIASALASCGLVVDLAAHGALQALWWTSNVGAVVVAIALVLRLPGANATGGFLVALGAAAWLVDRGPRSATSLVVQCVVFGCSLAGMRALRVPRQTWWRAVVSIAAVTALSGWFAGGNVNFASRVPASVAQLVPSHGVFVLSWLALLGCLAIALQLAIVHTGLARSTHVRLDPALVAPWPQPPARDHGERSDATLDATTALGGRPSQDRNAFEHPAIASYAKHVNPAHLRLLGMLGHGRVFVKARDVWVWDHEGRRYLDCLAGFSAVNVGHNHPRMVARMTRFLHENAMNFVQVGPATRLGELGERIAGLVDPPLERIIPTNGGAEAVEAGLKIARLATGRARWVYCAGAFHGSTLGALSVMGADTMRDPLRPLLSECVRVPFGDLDALGAALADNDVGGFLIDPGLCESGRVTAPRGYLARARELCRAHGTLMILDEIQTGLGRQGNLFIYKDEGFVPDVLLFAKSLSGGIAPIGVAVTSAEIHDRSCGSIAQIDTFSSTFGGNTLSCTAALEALDIIVSERLVDNSRERGAELLVGLQARLRDHPMVRDVRGRGLMVAIELAEPSEGWLAKLAPSLARTIATELFGLWATVQLLERGLLCQTATYHVNVLKLMPPLTIAPNEIATIVRVVGDFMDDYRDPTAIAADVVARLGAQAAAGWAF